MEAKMKNTYKNILLATLAATAVGCENKKKEAEYPYFVEGTVLEEKLYNAAPVKEVTKIDEMTTKTTTIRSSSGGDLVYVMKVKVSEPISATKTVEKTYTLTMRNNGGDEMPIEVLEQAIFPNTKIIFNYRNLGDGTLRWPIDSFGSIPYSSLHIVQPFEDPQEQISTLEREANKEYRQEVEHKEAQRFKEAKSYYKKLRTPKK
jgi:hypothetical protein